MALIMYLTKAPRYQNILTDEYETIPLDDLVLIDKYFFWSMRRAEGKTDAYTLEEWCGIPESRLPHKYVVNYYREFFTEKRFYKEYVGKVTGFSIFTQAARIVKANQIFRWFLENVMGGAPDKKYYEITREQLKCLLVACMRVKLSCKLIKHDDLQEKRLSVDEKTAKAYLPLMEEKGFFFGTSEYGSAYITDVIEAGRIVENILQTTDFEKEIVYFNATW